MVELMDTCKPKGAKKGLGGTDPGKPPKNGKNSILYVKNSILRSRKEYKTLITNRLQKGAGYLLGRIYPSSLSRYRDIVPHLAYDPTYLLSVPPKKEPGPWNYHLGEFRSRFPDVLRNFT
ncbi:hypothetical protein [Sphingobacterium mizutaii]|uniref:hypothetical protein n=1 Tax=Sphingobacterium mizutaii TaxID=1010 RepID=UPI003D955025